MRLIQKLSLAQLQFTQNILGIKYDVNDKSVLSRDTLIENLNRHGIKIDSPADLEKVITQLSDKNGSMTNIHRYIGGHVYNMYDDLNPLMKQILEKLGGMTDQDFKDTRLFIERIRRISEEAANKNCKLYVDAEQTYIQSAIESFGQQMTHRLNRENKTIIMNGYQCYLKRTL